MRTAARKSLYAIAVAAACLAAAPVHAQLNFGRMDTGLYLGAGVGGSEAHIDTSGINASKDESDIGWKIFGGYSSTATSLSKGAITTSAKPVSTAP